MSSERNEFLAEFWGLPGSSPAFPIMIVDEKVCNNQEPRTSVLVRTLLGAAQDKP